MESPLFAYVQSAFDSDFTYAETMIGVSIYFPGKSATAALYWSRLRRDHQKQLASQ
jgi:hypothetical protein